jgi:hypothetical protein
MIQFDLLKSKCKRVVAVNARFYQESDELKVGLLYMEKCPEKVTLIDPDSKFTVTVSTPEELRTTTTFYTSNNAVLEVSEAHVPE